MEYMFVNYPAHLGLDVSTDNTKAVNFYKRVGLLIENLYFTDKDHIEFASFKTPLGFIYKPPVYLKDVQQTNDADEEKKQDDK